MNFGKEEIIRNIVGQIILILGLMLFKYLMKKPFTFQTFIYLLEGKKALDFR